jgi:ligand-binding sensor domain-containing protein
LSAAGLGAVDDLALTAEAVYALYTPAGTQGSLAGAPDTMLARIDRASGAVRTAGPFPGARRVAVDSGSVWIGGNNEYPATPNPKTTGVVRLDAETLSVGLSLPLPSLPADRPAVAGFAASPDGLWLAYGAHLYQLNPTTGAVLRIRSLSGTASSIAVDSVTGKLYVGADAGAPYASATVSEWDPVNLMELSSAPTGGADLGGPDVAASGNDVWIAYATGMLGQIEHRRGSDLATLRLDPHLRFTNSVQVFTTERFVWVTDAMASTLDCLDPVTGAIRARRNVNLGGIVVGDGAGLYLGDLNGVSILTPDPKC